MTLNSLQGTMVLSSYVTEIFTSSIPNVSPIDASIAITLLLIGANLIYLNLVDRAGRRTIYIWSSLASTAGLLVYAGYLYYLTQNHAFDWVPIASISYVLFSSCLGMTPAPYIVMFEIMPAKVCKFAYSIFIHL